MQIRLESSNLGALVDDAAKALSEGKLIVYPTDTVYGIGGDATSAESFRKVLDAKGISSPRPMSVMVSDIEMLKEYCNADAEELEKIKQYLPGHYTFILEVKQSKLLPVSLETKKLGVRIPDNEFCIALCKKFGKPIITTSANITGNTPPVSFNTIDKSLLEKAAVSIDGGKTKKQAPSEIIDLVDMKFVKRG